MTNFQTGLTYLLQYALNSHEFTRLDDLVKSVVNNKKHCGNTQIHATLLENRGGGSTREWTLPWHLQTQLLLFTGMLFCGLCGKDNHDTANSFFNLDNPWIRLNRPSMPQNPMDVNKIGTH